MCKSPYHTEFNQTAKFCKKLFCVASVSVWFRSKEIPRKRTFGFDRARNDTCATFLAVFDSRSSFFSLNRTETLATQAKDY